MPNIKLVNIRFNLDGDDRDREIHDALFQHPDGARNQVIKAALYAYLIDGGANERERPSRARKEQVKKPVRRALGTGKDAPGRRDQDAETLPPPVQTAKPAEAANPSHEGQSTPSGEDQQVIAGLRSLIL